MLRRHRRAVSAAPLVLGLLLAFVVSCDGVAQTPPPSSPRNDVVPVDKKVTITVVDARTVKVDPEVFLARLGGPGIDFVVSGLPDKYSLEIDFRAYADIKGPFVKGTGPARGRYDVVGTGKDVTVSSGKVDSERVKTPSYWKYDIVLRDPARNDIAAIDPMGVLR